jgi:hypothetical protein
MTLPRNCHIWLPGYIEQRRQARRRRPPERVWLTFADHYEPLWNGADEATGADRIARWAREWPRTASKFRDSTGRPPCYTCFYPQEEYRPGLMEPLARLAQDRIVDVEVHLHHDGEGQQNFIDRMTAFVDALRQRHGLLRMQNGKTAFAFIHGNWALDNSRPDGRMCGLNNEIALLRDLGCYADFTMPSAPSPTQARLVNTIYWAVDDPHKPKSYDRGIPVAPGSAATGDLLMIPGPLGIRWRERLLPRLENGEVASYDPPTPYRVRRWIDLAPRIGADSFVKLHTHGLQERHCAFLMQGGLELLFGLMTEECRRAGCELRFASAWEMRQAVDAAWRGGGILEPAPVCTGK